MNNPEKWADKDCDVCGGTGVVQNAFSDDSYICHCAQVNKAEHDGEIQSDQEREDKALQSD